MATATTDPAVVAAIEAEFSRAVREAARVATLRMLGKMPPLDRKIETVERSA